MPKFDGGDESRVQALMAEVDRYVVLEHAQAMAAVRAEAENERLREALGMAIYHADNLRRYIDHEVVRDLDESGHGLERARKALDA